MPVPVPDYTSSIRRMSTITIPNQDIRFDSYIDLYATSTPSSSPNPFESRELEAAFCRDFFCCGLVHPDLHALLQHYEECHVEDYEEDADDAFPVVVDNDFLLPENNLAMEAAAAGGVVVPISGSGSSPAFLENTITDAASAAATPDPMLLQLQKKRASAYVYREEHENDEELLLPLPSPPSSSSAAEAARLPPASPGTCRKRPQSALDLLTQSAAKRLAIFDEDLLAQASALLASAATHSFDSNADKPYKCHVTGCQKAYKNPNGLKYHNQHGHCEVVTDESESIISKPYQCTIGDCGKRYKNLNGLKYHIEHSHMAALNHTLAALNASFIVTAGSPSTPPLSPFDGSDTSGQSTFY